MIPIPVPTNGRTYTTVFVIFLFFWPLFLFTSMIDNKRHPSNPTFAVCVLIALMIASYILNYVRCSSPQLSYWGGLCVVAGFWRSGCVQITALIILPLLFAIHFWMTIISVASFVSGKATAENAFLRACRRFAPRAFEPSAGGTGS